MSRYGSVNVTSPTSLITRLVQSSESDDLQSKTNAAIASLPAGYIVVGITLAGAGDGFTFTVTVEAGAMADVTGGFTSPPTVACFLGSEAGALLVQRGPAGPTSGPFADTQVAGASKGSRFMGLVVKGDVNGGAPSAAPVYQEAWANVPIASGDTATPVTLTPPDWTPGDIAIIEWWAFSTRSPDDTGINLSVIPFVDVGSGPVNLNANDGAADVLSNTTGVTSSMSTSFASPVAPTVSLQCSNGDSDLRVRILLRVTRVSPSLFQGAPSGTLP